MYTIKRSYKSEDTYQRVGFWARGERLASGGSATGARLARRRPATGDRRRGGDDRPLVARRRLQIGGHGATWAGANWGRGATGASGLSGRPTRESRGGREGERRDYFGNAAPMSRFEKAQAHATFIEAAQKRVFQTIQRRKLNVYRGGPNSFELRTVFVLSNAVLFEAFYVSC
jgi:hypothetical protein